MIKTLKSEKGITLISLIVYITVMLIVVTIVGTVTSYFYANVNDAYKESKDENGEATLDMYLTKDLKNKKIIIDIAEPVESEKDIKKTTNLQYENGEIVTYTIVIDKLNDNQNQSGIYRNAVKIYNIAEGQDMSFKIVNVSPTGSVINEKVELQLLTKDNKIFKSHIVNVETKVVYDN